MDNLEAFIRAFWAEACATLTRNACALLAAAGEPVTIEGVIEVVRSLPRSQEELYENRWRQSLCGRCLLMLAGMDANAKTNEDLADFFLNRIVTLSRDSRRFLEESVIGVLRGFTGDS